MTSSAEGIKDQAGNIKDHAKSNEPLQGKRKNNVCHNLPARSLCSHMEHVTSAELIKLVMTNWLS